MKNACNYIGFILPVLLVSMIASTGRADARYDESETKYLMFQVFVYAPSTDPNKTNVFPPSDELAKVVDNIIHSIGATGNTGHKLGFIPGPLSFNSSDAEIHRLIKESFEIARKKNVAVAFHIDDQMFWENRKDLINDVNNIEWINWNETLNTGRRLDWSATPTKVAPQMCLNSAAIKKAVIERANFIGGEIKRELDELRRAHKEELFAGVIAGWETMIGHDFATNHYLGYHAMSNKGFSAANPPKDFDGEVSKVVKEFMELWAKELAAAGVPKNKIYAHIAFTSQGLQTADAASSFAQNIGFATPDVAFSSHYRPGFSTYPDIGTIEEIHKEINKHGNLPWISAEGTNVVPNGEPGEATMETYLGKMFNHNAVMVNIFSFGIGGEAEKNKNLFRLATENKEALSAYRKFLNGETLIERKRPADTFSPTLFQQKIRRIQAELPAWIQKTHEREKVEPLMQKLDGLIKQSRFQEADKIANEILKRIDTP
ncbi:MAG: hypothetical protein IAF08_08585 [Rhizobacter sp.]|nr:hypothetical protein [Chlorobiales bacterium]